MGDSLIYRQEEEETRRGEEKDPIRQVPVDFQGTFEKEVEEISKILSESGDPKAFQEWKEKQEAKQVFTGPGH